MSAAPLAARPIGDSAAGFGLEGRMTPVTRPLADLFPGLAGPEADRAISGLASDSRKVEPGFAFVAIPGTKADGSLFVADALRRGAAAIADAEFHHLAVSRQRPRQLSGGVFCTATAGEVGGFSGAKKRPSKCLSLHGQNVVRLRF